jgi:membrane protein implicated in regulation of membrane protease activity
MDFLLPFVTQFVLILLLAMFIVPGIFMVAWNIAMPTILKLPRITYWQAFSFLLVVSILSNSVNGGLIRLTQNPQNTLSTIHEDVSELRKDVSLMRSQVDALERRLKDLHQ